MDNSIRMYAYWEDQDWHPISTWPNYLVNMAISGHLNNRDGYRFFLFLVGNGYDPYKASRILVNKYDYDQYQATHLIKTLKSGKLTGTYWDLQLKHIVKI